jgi:RNA polymerase sigma-70 factor (ECF subfamily)
VGRAAIPAIRSELSISDRAVCRSLVRGDEAAFEALVGLYHASLRRLAITYVRSPAIADEVVQETWLGVLRGISSFDGRSSLKTWIFRILANTAKTRGERERRSVPISALTPADHGPTVDAARFLDEHHGRWAGHWASPPVRWQDMPEEHLLGHETIDRIHAAIARLPPLQRRVIVLRDVDGWPADEVCVLLGLSESNQRVCLHRARATVRQALEDYLGPRSS